MAVVPKSFTLARMVMSPIHSWNPPDFIRGEDVNHNESIYNAIVADEQVTGTTQGRAFTIGRWILG